MTRPDPLRGTHPEIVLQLNSLEDYMSKANDPLRETQKLAGDICLLFAKTKVKTDLSRFIPDIALKIQLLIWKEGQAAYSKGYRQGEIAMRERCAKWHDKNCGIVASDAIRALEPETEGGV